MIAPLAAAQDYDRNDALQVSQAAVGRSLGAFDLRDESGQHFVLSTVSGKPLVISMIYTSCHHV